MNYKIHIAYVTTNGTVVTPGIYKDTEFDLAEARNKSIVTLENTSVEVETTPVVDDIPLVKLEPIVSDISTIELKAVVSNVKATPVKINTAKESDLVALKHIGVKIAKKVIAERAVSKFVSYDDLDKRVPLTGGKKWQDITYLDFELPTELKTENILRFV